MTLRNILLLILSMSIVSCKHNAAIQVTPITPAPVVDTITHIDSFKGYFHYSYEKAERSTEDWQIQDSFSKPSTVYIVYLKDSIRIYDNFYNTRGAVFYGTYETDGGKDSNPANFGLFACTVPQNDSGKFTLLDDYFVSIKNDSLKYATSYFPTFHKGGYIDRKISTFFGKKVK